jgi:hypothetical protein
MGRSIAAPAWRRSAFSRRLAWLLCALLSAPARAQPPVASPVPAITAITLERDCFGCPTGSLLVLRGDGNASYTITGKARHGTEDRSFSGSVGATDFDGLARLVASQGFFELDEIYDDPQAQDGAWTTIGVARGAQDKRVFRRDGAGPQALRTIEAAIEAVRSRITFTAERR